MQIPRTLRKISVSLFVGLCLTTLFTVHIAADDLPDSALYLAFLLLSLSGLFTALAYLLLRHTARRLRVFSRRAQGMWVAGAALAGALATVAIPTAPPPVWVWTDVTITPLNARDPAACLSSYLVHFHLSAFFGFLTLSVLKKCKKYLIPEV
jgi:hypothetical protein